MSPSNGIPESCWALYFHYGKMEGFELSHRDSFVQPLRIIIDVNSQWVILPRPRSSNVVAHFVLYEASCLSDIQVFVPNADHSCAVTSLLFILSSLHKPHRDRQAIAETMQNYGLWAIRKINRTSIFYVFYAWKYGMFDMNSVPRHDLSPHLCGRYRLVRSFTLLETQYQGMK